MADVDVFTGRRFSIDLGAKRLMKRLLELRCRVMETCPTCGRTLKASIAGVFYHETACLRRER